MTSHPVRWGYVPILTYNGYPGDINLWNMMLPQECICHDAVDPQIRPI